MKPRFRLRRSTDFKRVRQFGTSYSSPEVVLIKISNNLENARVGVSASRSVGNAVQRNRAKRRIRAIIDQFLPLIRPGWDIVLLARSYIQQANYNQLEAVIKGLLNKADLLKEAGE